MATVLFAALELSAIQSLLELRSQIHRDPKMPKQVYGSASEPDWTCITYAKIVFRASLRHGYLGLFFKMTVDIRQVLYFIDAKSVGQMIDGYS